ncbi:hypothetical protein B7R87_06135 [Streptomyces tsukubensis]|uniref:Uncharacterized protein n=1 Tax=Streptomyces tsukubensis (strain DSM 42081 / NBRC 108919 / NRRL 18488 / 9993) TaxID=1114943 RepID=A0A7G3UMB7_STRT9|nr:hypothetical protein B7R87_06135 [Streptomyces tsukubensis]QKM70350.1 hypothetical protein STSU_027680 [Streptomyces tsukubensis NRRL18488]TAI45665.1 hypothetical protein EWI31_00485 [Streptomyces tsukubensis]
MQRTDRAPAEAGLPAAAPERAWPPCRCGAAKCPDLHHSARSTSAPGTPGTADCPHQWVGWSGQMRCRLCGATQQQ